MEIKTAKIFTVWQNGVKVGELSLEEMKGQMRLIDADALKTDLTRFYDNEVTAKWLIDEQPTIDAIPVDWMVQRMNETSGGSGMNVELNNALFAVGVEWERWKKSMARMDDASEGGTA